MKTQISCATSGRFSMIDYGDSLELQDWSGGALTFNSVKEPCQLVDFIESHLWYWEKEREHSKTGTLLVDWHEVPETMDPDELAIFNSKPVL